MHYINFLFILILTVLSGYLYIQNKKLRNYKKNILFISSAIEHLPMGIYIKDLKGNCIVSNKELSNITGHSKKEITGKNIKEIFAENDIEKIQQEDYEVLSQKQTIKCEKQLSSQNHIYQTIKSPIFDKKNNIIGIISILKNIDKEKELEHRKESFIATLTHDLKSPTTAQLNMLNLLLDEQFGELNTSQKDMIKLTCSSCTYILDLVSTILTTYHSDCCKLQLNIENFDIIEAVNSLCDSYRYLVTEKNQQIIFNHNMSSCLVNGDKLQIKRVIANLLSNAIIYGFKNSKVIIDLIQTDKNIEFSVTNTSLQIPENDLKKIFKRFTKTQMSHFNKVSTSLGLYLSKQIIDLHEGEIYAKSFPDGTCIFGFRIANKNNEQLLITK